MESVPQSFYGNSNVEWLGMVDMKRAAFLIGIVFLYCSMIYLSTSNVYALGAPVIYSVSAISSATDSQTIYINGSGFGNTSPQTVSLGDGSVDTVVSTTTPSLAIGNPGKWAAGIENASNGVHCAIGIIINSWSDNQIVLGGFGTALGTNGQGTWNIATGDVLNVAVYTQYGDASYNATTVPEFSSFLILIPFAMATLLAALVYRGKLRALACP